MTYASPPLCVSRMDLADAWLSRGCAGCRDSEEYGED